VQVFVKFLSFKKKIKWRMFYTPIPKDRYAVVGGKFDHEGLWLEKGGVLEKQIKW